MSKMKTKEIIICILTIIALIISLSAQVFAAQNLGDLDEEVEEESGEIPDRTEEDDAENAEEDDSKIDNKIDNKVDNKIDNKIDNKTNNTSNNTSNNSAKMPNAGVDYSIVFVIITCGVSTIYAYKKIREYNNF